MDARQRKTECPSLFLRSDGLSGGDTVAMSCGANRTQAMHEVVRIWLTVPSFSLRQFTPVYDRPQFRSSIFPSASAAGRDALIKVKTDLINYISFLKSPRTARDSEHALCIHPYNHERRARRARRDSHTRCIRRAN